MIAAWQSLARVGHAKISGHSARRSGAKRNARNGMALDDIQALGRWGGATVLEYVEEAFTEAPRGLPTRTAASAAAWSATILTSSSNRNWTSSATRTRTDA